MAISKEKKQALVEKMSTVVKAAGSLVFVQFRALKMSDTTSMRKALKGNGIGYLVTKKTLLARALGESKIEGEAPVLPGEIAVAYGTDILAPAREIYTISKKHKDNLSIVGGIFEGKYMNKEEMLAIALIPSRQVLLAQFVNLIASPMTGLVVGLNQIAMKKQQ